MLSALHISKYVLIDQLDLDLSAGLGIISGETGAGKSILLGALSLLMGHRADTTDIAPGADRCTLEATFTQLDPKLATLFEENGLDFDPEECIIRREISLKGKSRAFINDTPAPISTVRLLADYLIDIHSQHKNLLLTDAGFQLSVIDLYAQAEPLMAQYGAAYQAYTGICLELDTLTASLAESRREADYLQYQLDELIAAALIPQEEESLELELQSLSHAQDIRLALSEASSRLQGEDASLVESLRQAEDVIHGIEQYLPAARDYVQRMHSVRIEIADITTSIDRMAEDIQVDPAKLTLVESRLDCLNGLMHKHHVSSSEALISLRDEMDSRLQRISTESERICELTEAKKQAYDTLRSLAGELRNRRLSAANELEGYLVQALRPLGMPDVRFEVRLDTLSEPSSKGVDRAVFLFSANRHLAPEPVAEIASGGEIARLMLCLKALMAGKRSLPTIIFDEIDTGVSGDIAERMGRIMQQMGEAMQVLAITHLPQIAARGSVHYYVYKENHPDRTETRVRQLSETQRVDEIARMQSGSALTDISRAAAADLLARSRG